MTNLDGKSTVYYEAQNRSGSRVARFAYPINGYDVTFAFDELVRDGIWELQSKPLRGTNTDNVYVISIAQTAGGQEPAAGQVTFTKDVAPILQARCQVCHRPDTFAPMSLLTYEEARPWADRRPPVHV